MSDCGCRIVHRPCNICLGEPEHGPPAIVYCPLHAAAEQMREALAEMMQVAFDGPDHPISSSDYRNWRRGIEERAREALAATEVEA